MPGAKERHGPIARYTPDDLPASLPVFPLPGVLLLPRGRLPLNIFEPRYLAMVDAALSQHRLIGMIQPEPGAEGSVAPALYDAGCAGRITSFSETGDGRYLITLTGVCRFRVQSELATLTPFRIVRADFGPFLGDLSDGDAEQPLPSGERQRLLAALRLYLDRNNLKVNWPGLEDLDGEALVNSLCMICPFGAPEKQALLVAPDLAERARVLVALIEMAAAQPFGDAPAKLQ